MFHKVMIVGTSILVYLVDVRCASENGCQPLPQTFGFITFISILTLLPRVPSMLLLLCILLLMPPVFIVSCQSSNAETSRAAISRFNNRLFSCFDRILLLLCTALLFSALMTTTNTAKSAADVLVDEPEGGSHYGTKVGDSE
jgi:hypothetical protein